MKNHKIIFKIISFVIVLFLSFTCLAGCNLTEIDVHAYYNQVVCVAGNYTFTKKDLIVAFNNYGYKYYQNGATLEDSVNSTITSMVQRQILLDKVKDILARANVVSANGELTDKQQAKVRYNAFNNMQSSLNNFESEIRSEWKIETVWPEEATIQPLRAVKENYSSKLELDEDLAVVRKSTYKEHEGDVPMHFVQFITDEEVSNKAWVRYISTLQDSAKNEKRSIVENDVLLYEEERLLKIYTENEYLELFEDYYLTNTSVNTNKVVEEYKKQYKDQAANEIEDYFEMMKDVSSVYYHFYNPNLYNYIYVDHILLKFSDYQIYELKTRCDVMGWDYTTDNSENETYTESYPEWLEHLDDGEISRIVSQTKCTYEIDGETKTNNAEFILNHIKNYFNSHVSSQSNLRTIATVFDEMKYIFNDDTGNMNNKFNYAVNLTDATDNIMVKTFTDKSRELYYGANGKKGIMDTDWTVSSFGLHLILYLQPVTNIVSRNTIDSLDYLTLFSNYVNPSSDTTLFEYYYDKLDLDGSSYNNRASELISEGMSTIKENGKFEIYRSAVSDLY